MSYTKTVWQDEVLDGAERFELLKNIGGAVDAFGDLANCQIQLTTPITQTGTPLIATNMNKIEDGIEELYGILEGSVAKNINFTGTITASGGWSGALTVGGLITGEAGLVLPAGNLEVAEDVKTEGRFSKTNRVNGIMLMRCTFEGGKPYATDFQVNTNGHLGQQATVSGGVIGRPGKFGKAVQVAEATTNLILNPIFENNITDGWSGYGSEGSDGVAEHDTSVRYIGSASLKLTAGTLPYKSRLVSDPFVLANGETATVQCRVYKTNSYDALLTISDQVGIAALASDITNEMGWVFLTATYTNSSGAAINCVVTLANRAGDSTTVMWFDAIQAEKKAYPTPLCYGGMGDGHSWAGAAHNSTSYRNTAGLAYPVVGNVDINNFSISMQIKMNKLDQIDVRYPFQIRGVTSGEIAIWIYPDGHMRIYYGASLGDSGIVITAGGWHNIIFTCDNGNCALYVDGNSILIGSGAGIIGVPEYMYIGMNADINRHINGLIDDFAILDRALTANEVKAIYDNSILLQLFGSDTFDS